MPPETITTEQREWGNHFEKFLVIPTKVTPSKPPQLGDEDDDDEDADEYGKGYEKLKMSLPKPFQQALDLQLTAKKPKMISKEVWDQAAVVPTEDDLEGSLGSGGRRPHLGRAQRLPAKKPDPTKDG